MPDYLITLSLPTDLPVGPVNVYLVKGEVPTLVDTGPKSATTENALRDALAAHGVALRDLRRLIVTHAHIDHFGLAGRIVYESGAQVLSLARNFYWLTEYHLEWARRFGYYGELFARLGVPRPGVDAMLEGISGLMPMAESIPVHLFGPLEDLQTVRLGPDDWRVIHAPGHASGLIVLYEPKSRTLLSSDHLLPDITSNPLLEPPARSESERPRALRDYLRSLRRVAEYDIAEALPSHGVPIYDVPALFDARQAFHRRRVERIARMLDVPRTPYEVCSLLFPNLMLMDIFLGMSEVLGHLDLLEDEGRVKITEEEDVLHYVLKGK